MFAPKGFFGTESVFPAQLLIPWMLIGILRLSYEKKNNKENLQQKK